MHKINLISVNSKFIHSSLAVLSLETMYYKYADLFSLNMPELTVTERTINDSFDSLIHSVINGADIYAFSVYIWNVSLVKKICRYIRLAKPGSTIILGGPEISYTTDFDENDYDYIISGEGERAFFALICEICGFFISHEWNYIKDGKIRRADFTEDLSEISFPYNDRNIDRFSDRIIYYESSRGCPFSCAYCLSSVCGKVRELPLERVFCDLDYFISRDVAQVKFVDRTFNCNHDRAKKIWQYIISKAQNCNTNFHFEIGADLLTADEIQLLSTAGNGRIQLEAGIQSTDEKALDECCRHTNLDLLFENVIKLVTCANINIHVDLIAGLPYETIEVFKKSFNDAYRLNAHQLQLGFLKRLNGAPLNDMLQKHSYVFSPYPPYEIISDRYMSTDDILYLKKIEDMVERFYNSRRFLNTLREMQKLYATPFDMFDELARLFEEENLTFKPVSTKVLYNFLSRILKSRGADCDRILLLDYYVSEKSDIVPSELKYLALKHGNSDLINEAKHGNKKAQVKFIENDAYIIDYSARNPVSGIYEISEVIKNVCL